MISKRLCRDARFVEVVGELFGGALEIGRTLLDRRGDPTVVEAPLAAEHPCQDTLASKRMPESVGLWDFPHDFIDEVAIDCLAQHVREVVVGEAGHACEQRDFEASSDHRSHIDRSLPLTYAI